MWFYHARSLSCWRLAEWRKTMGKCCFVPSITPEYHTDIQWGFQLFFNIFDLISFILFHFNHIFAELIFHCCAWSSCGEISVLQYVYVCVFITVHAMLDALGVYGAPRRQVGLTRSLLPHSLIPITWLYMTLRYLCYRCFCLCALSPTHLFPFHFVCSFSFQILESELWDHLS